MTMNQTTLAMILRLNRAGISQADSIALRRCAMTLSRWHELECGTEHGGINRDEVTGKPHWYNSRTCQISKTPIPDREKGALARICKIISRYPDLAAYVQGDPRGAPLYIYRPDQLDGRSIDTCYSSIGIAVHK